MTKDRKPTRNALDRLADAMMEDVLKSSDEEILAEVSESDGELAPLEAGMQKLLDKTLGELKAAPSPGDPQSNAAKPQPISGEANIVVSQFRAKAGQSQPPVSIRTSVPAAGQPRPQRMERAAASSRRGHSQSGQKPIRPYDRIWIDGIECTVLHSGSDERIYVEGALVLEATSVVLGGERWPLQKVATEGDVVRYEIIGMTLGTMDDLSDSHSAPDRSGWTE
jgi:hypothetical protein